MTQPLRVVFVEDSPDDAEVMALHLAAGGYQLDWRRVDTEPDYLAVLDTAPPDLILADWSLPQFSGLRALQLMRSRNLDIPFIIVSGSIGEEAAIDALRQGAYDYVLKDSPNRLVRAVLHVLEEKRLREDRRQTLEVLFQLRRAVEQSPVLVVITDLQGNIEYVNPKFIEATGYTFDELRGKNPRILKSGEMPAAEYRKLWHAITSGDDWRGEFHNRRKDGTLYWERAILSPLRDSSGAITHFLGVKEDITVQKELETQFMHAQKMESIGRFAGGVAHDFNNLLTVINGYCDVALSGLKDGDPLRHPLSQIRKGGRQAAALTKQLLAFSRKQVIRLRPVDVNRLISEGRSMFERLMGEDIEVVLDLSPGASHVLADDGQLHQVLMNLAVNSRDAMVSGGRFTLRTRSSVADSQDMVAYPWIKPGRYLEISAADTGCGIHPEDNRRIFEPFFTTKGPGHGTGLGLSTAYGIVRQCGGWISFSSEPGKGTIFKVHLPEVDAAAEAERAPSASGDLRGSEKVLLVEDHDDVRGFVAQALRDYGYTVLEARTPLEALSLVNRQGGTIDLMLTDIIMPQMTGTELAERLRPGCRDMRVLFMSGYSDDVIVQRGMVQAQLDYIAKPFSDTALAEKVRQMLDKPAETK